MSPYLFAVYLHDLTVEIKNTKIGCNIGEVVLNHLMFADDIRVFDVCMVCVCMVFIKTKSAKKHGHPVADTGWTKYKIYYDK